MAMEIEIRDAITEMVRNHGPITRTTCSSRWDWGVYFEDGYQTRIAFPIDVEPFEFKEWLYALTKVPVSAWLRNYGKQS